MSKYQTPAWSDNTAPDIDAAALTAIGQGIELAQHPYAECSTAASTAAKTASIDVSGTLALFAGLCVRIKFTNGNTAANPTLNVNGTGAKAVLGTDGNTASWVAGSLLELVYDGTSWIASAAVGTPQIATGVYTGTGTAGAANPTSLTFPFVPVFLIVAPEYNGFFGMTRMTLGDPTIVWVESQDSVAIVSPTGSWRDTLNISRSGKTVSWANRGSPDPATQLNVSGSTYHYFALGW